MVPRTRRRWISCCFENYPEPTRSRGLRIRAAVLIIVLSYATSLCTWVEAAHCCSHDSSPDKAHHTHDRGAPHTHDFGGHTSSDVFWAPEEPTLEGPSCCGAGGHIEVTGPAPHALTAQNSGRQNLSAETVPGSLGTVDSGSEFMEAGLPCLNRHPPPSSSPLQSLLTVFLLI